jgi:hypothetical protein
MILGKPFLKGGPCVFQEGGWVLERFATLLGEACGLVGAGVLLSLTFLHRIIFPSPA